MGKTVVIISFSLIWPLSKPSNCPQAETHLVFPQSASFEQLRFIRESIAAELDLRMRTDLAAPPAAAPLTAPHSSAAATARPAAPPAQQPSSLVGLSLSVIINRWWNGAIMICWCLFVHLNMNCTDLNFWQSQNSCSKDLSWPPESLMVIIH